jgi:hypothetical protein
VASVTWGMAIVNTSCHPVKKISISVQSGLLNNCKVLTRIKGEVKKNSCLNFTLSQPWPNQSYTFRANLV